MASKAAAILASALEHDADAHELRKLDNLDVRIEAVRREIVSCNDIPEPIYKLALRFWKEWARASRHGWNYHGSISENDWPAMARTIAQHVRTGSLPPDKLIIDNFVRRRSTIQWRDIKRLFDDSA